MNACLAFVVVRLSVTHPRLLWSFSRQTAAHTATELNRLGIIELPTFETRTDPC